MNTPEQIKQDWTVIRDRYGLDIWKILRRPVEIKFVPTLPAGDIKVLGKVFRSENTLITAKAKSIRTILQSYPETCTGSILLTISAHSPAAPDVPDIEPKLPPQLPPSDNDTIQYA